MYLTERGCFGFGIDLAQGRDQWKALMETVMNLRARHIFEKPLSSFGTGGFS
jgi:hypothetical protein